MRGNDNLLTVMDPITHALAGVTLWNLGFRRKFALGVALFASVAPDLDYITRFWGTDVFLRYHRGITHGVFALIAVSLMVGLVLGLKRGFLYYFFLSALAYCLHLLFDLMNQYPMRLFSPLDWQGVSLDLTFIIDPYISGGLLLAVVICAMKKKKATAIAFTALILIGAYAGGRYYLHEKTEDFLRDNLRDYVCKLSPLPNDFLRWWFVAKSKSDIKVGFADLFTKRVCIQETYPLDVLDPAIEGSKEDRVVKSFLSFARYPYAEVKRQDGRITVIWRELSFSFMPGERFTAKVVMDRDGKVLSSNFKF